MKMSRWTSKQLSLGSSGSVAQGSPGIGLELRRAATCDVADDLSDQCSTSSSAGKSRLVSTRSDGQAGLLAKAALSHLHLALLNLDQHVYALQGEEHAELRRAEARLHKLTNSSSPKSKASRPVRSSEDKTADLIERSFCLQSAPIADIPDILEKHSEPQQSEVELPGVLEETPVETKPSGPSSTSNRASGRRSATKESTPIVVLSEPKMQQLLDMFDEIDGDDSGSIRGAELREVLTRLGISPAKATKMLHAMDHDGDGTVNREEWKQMVDSMARQTAPEQLHGFIDELLKLRASGTGRLFTETRRERCVMFHDSAYRVAWDIFIMCLLSYIAVTLPFMLGFRRFMSESLAGALNSVETTIDFFFVLDIILNFRTTYVSGDGNHITNGRLIAFHYLKSWFFLDFISSIPFDLMFTFLPNLQVAKLLKVGKVIKAVRLLRIGRLIKKLERNEIIEEIMMKSRWALKLARLSIMAFSVCHWLASFMGASGIGYLDAYQDVGSSLMRRYLAAVYWAMTTMTTVGYGDIIPHSDTERAYAILAMILGGGFYGYVIGSITSVISTTDANTHAYFERLDLIQAWLNHHHEVPKTVARRIRRHFKRTLLAKTAMDDAAILSDLTPELRIELSRHIVDEEVRHNMLFEGLPNTALAKLVPILAPCHAEINDKLATTGEPGVAMFIVLDGSAHMSWTVGDHYDERKLEAGDSFGEEIILQLDQYYRYTVIALSQMRLHMIQEMSFMDCFNSMPDMLLLMRENFMRMRRPEIRHNECLSANIKRFRESSRTIESKRSSTAFAKQISGGAPHVLDDEDTLQ